MSDTDAAIAFLKKTLENTANASEDERNYRISHSLRVAQYAKQIATDENQNVRVALLSAILHDVGKFESLTEEDHGRVSADIAMEFIQTLDIPEKEKSDIHYCIATHADDNAGYEYEHIPEAGTVSDADNIDRFGAFRIYQMMAWSEVDHLSPQELSEQCEKWIATRVRYLTQDIISTPSARRLFQEKLETQIQYFRNLADEMNLTKQII